MEKPRAFPVFLPDNEPHLGHEHLLAFDQAIPNALREHARIGSRTFAASGGLTPIQIAATEIIPQGVSIALSIRELIRQAYLYSAAILVRPLIERTGTIQYLHERPDALAAWRAGWPRKNQPTLDVLLRTLHPKATEHDAKHMRLVKPSVVYAMYGVRSRDKAHMGLVATTGRFSEKTREMCQKTWGRQVGLRDGEEFVDWIRKLKRGPAG